MYCRIAMMMMMVLTETSVNLDPHLQAKQAKDGEEGRKATGETPNKTKQPTLCFGVSRL
jgi:hypothetical protein